MTTKRIKFKNSQDWHNYVKKVQQFTGKQLKKLRDDCYIDIEKIRKRPVLVYATKFIGDNVHPNIPNSIDLGDVDGFTDLVNSIDDKKVDILLHSPGGRPDATERIVSILRNKFDEINFLIPHSAYSAATMLALSGAPLYFIPVQLLDQLIHK